MRPQQQNRRMRGRGGNNNNNNNNRKGPNPLTRSYESNGPDVKIRGTAQQVADKYTTLARDAQSSGDRVIGENYLQHAEHYNRIIATAQAAQQQQQQQNARDNRDDDDEDDADDRGYSDSSNAPQNANTQNANTQNGASQNGDRQQRNRVDDGSGPQPTFDGPPAEVALNQQREDQPKREEKAVNGQRADRVNGTVSDTAEAASGSSEGDAEPAQKKPRRPRRTARSRAEGTDDEGEAKPADASDSPPEAATQG